MNRHPVSKSDPCDLDALLAAITEAIQALVAWDVTAFQAAVDRQRRIYDRLVSCELGELSNASSKAQQVRDLNRVYERLLVHSIRWTRTVQSILKTRAAQPARPSLHWKA